MFAKKDEGENASDGKTLDDKYFMVGKGAASASVTPIVSQIISKPAENAAERDHDQFLNKVMEDQLKQQEKLK